MAKLIKVNEALYNYLKRTGEIHFGRGKSMPYYLYLIAKRINNGRNQRD